MELKVWVDGIKRVVCGVTDNTTCQDIVIALAQAMGRTGRFTLIEKWRENERPLAPTECPLLVLQKWGEFAGEVKLMLYESGTRRKQKLSEKENDALKVPDRFTHNFTPPIKTSEAVIRRSLTFSGGRKQEPSAYKRPGVINFQRQSNQGPQGPGVDHHQSRHLQAPDKVISNGSSCSNGSSMSPQNSIVPLQQSRRRRSSSHDRITSSHDHITSSHDHMTSSHDHVTSSHDHMTSSHDHMTSSHDRMTSSHDRQRPSPSLLSNQIAPHATFGPQHSNHVPQFSSKTPQYSNHGPQLHQSATQRPDSHNSIPVTMTTSNQNNCTSQNHKHSANIQPKHTSTVPISNGPTRSSPNRPGVNGPIRSSPNRPGVNGPVHSSAFLPVQPIKNSFERLIDTPRISDMDIPIYTDHRKSSRIKHELEEYDLDSNFPDVVKETGQDRLIEEFHMPGGSGQSHPRNLMSREEEERVKLLRLATMQNERIKMQDSQLEVIDTEINSREQNNEDLKLEINHVTDDILRMSDISKEQDEEIHNLDNGTLIGEMELERLTEQDIKNEISTLRSRFEKCENDLHQFQSKVQICGADLQMEQEVLKTDEKRRREEEVKLEADISKLRKEVDERSTELDEKSKLYEGVETELKSVSEQLNHKTGDLTSTEKELQRENLKFFHHPQGSATIPGSGFGKADGEAVIKVLEGSIAPKLKQSKKMVESPLVVLQITKKDNGVWV